MSDALSEDLRAFVVEYVSSVAQLEALLLLRRDDRAWTLEGLARELRIDVQPARELLTDLCDHGLAACHKPTEEFRYAPRRAELANLVSRLEQAYEDRRVTIIGLIYSSTGSKVQVFADAFRIRKDHDG